MAALCRYKKSSEKLSILNIDTPRWALPLLSPSRYKGAHGGRGSGKSHFFAELLVEEHIRNPNQSSVCVREIQLSLNQSVKRLLENKIQDLNVGSYFEVQDKMIKSKHGPGLIIFQGMQNHTADSIKSLEGYDRAWVEEAQSLSQHSLDLLRPTIRKPGSELWFSWNPRSSTDPVDVLLRSETPPPGTTVVEVNFTDNPWFPDVLREEMEYDRGRDPDKYAHVWLGGYLQNSEARVFKNWKVEEFETPVNSTLRFGADWGFASDPTVLVRCFIEGRKLFIDYEAYMVGCEIVNIPDLFMTVPEAERWPITADSARPETISHVKKHGFPRIMAAVKGPKSLEDGIEWLKSFEIIVHPRCKHTIDELSLYSYKTDKMTQQVLPVLEDKENHVIDALRYACEGLRRAGKRVENRPRVAQTNYDIFA
jgi:phage terminase large subunit